MTKRIHANNAVTLLDGTITAIATSLTVIDSSAFPAIGAGEAFRLTLQASTGEIEIVEVTDASLAPTLTVTRAMEGTTGFAFPNGSLVSLRTTKDSHDRKQDQIANSSDVIDFGGATSFEIPNSAAPAITVSGQMALDTSVTDYADGLVCYQAGSTLYGLIAIPLSDLSTPSDGFVVTYDATTDKFKLAVGGGGGYTDEMAQDAVGAMIDTTLEYVDATPLLRRAALTGDVTASAGSNITTIADGAVSLAKQANVATSTVFYRKTAGAGAPEVQTLATLKTDLGLTGTNSGDQTITLTGEVTGSGTGSFAATVALPSSVTPATDDKVYLFDTSASDAKKYSTVQSIVDLGSRVLLATATASNSTSIDFTGLTSDFIAYEIIFTDVIPATDASNFGARFGTGGTPTYDTGNNYSYSLIYCNDAGTNGVLNSASLSYMNMCNSVGNAANEVCHGKIMLYNPSQTSGYHSMSFETAFTNSLTVPIFYNGQGTYRSATAVTAIRLLMSAGNITSGKFKLYGLRA